MTIVIETARLRLRGWLPGDGRRFAALTNTPAVMRWLGGPAPIERFEESEARQRRLQAEHGHCFWIVERKADGAMLGFCGIKLAESSEPGADGLPEIGWRLREDAWGQGYAREAAVASLDRAFDQLRAETVVAFTLAGNTASWGLMERLGMVRQPDFIEARLGPELNPTIYYRIDRAGWAARRQEAGGTRAESAS